MTDWMADINSQHQPVRQTVMDMLAPATLPAPRDFTDREWW